MERTGVIDNQHILHATASLDIQRREIAKSRLRMAGHGAEDEGLSDLEAEQLLWEDAGVDAGY